MPVDDVPGSVIAEGPDGTIDSGTAETDPGVAAVQGTEAVG